MGIYLSRTFNFLTLLTRLYADTQSKNNKIAITSISGLLPIPSLRLKNMPIQHRMTDKQSMINDNITLTVNRYNSDLFTIPCQVAASSYF